MIATATAIDAGDLDGAWITFLDAEHVSDTLIFDRGRVRSGTTGVIVDGTSSLAGDNLLVSYRREASDWTGQIALELTCRVAHDGALMIAGDEITLENGEMLSTGVALFRAEDGDADG